MYNRNQDVLIRLLTKLNQITEPLKELRAKAKKRESTDDLLKWLAKQRGKRATRDLELRVLRKLVPVLENVDEGTEYERVFDDIERLTTAFTTFDRFCRRLDGKELERIGKKIATFFFPEADDVHEAFEMVLNSDIPLVNQSSLVSFPFPKTISRSKKRPFHGYFANASRTSEIFCKAYRNDEVAEPVKVGTGSQETFRGVRFSYIIEEVYESKKKLSKTERDMLLHTLKHSGIILVEGSVEYPEEEEEEEKEKEEEEEEEPEPVFVWDDDDGDSGYDEDDFTEFLLMNPSYSWFFQRLDMEKDGKLAPDPVKLQCIYYAHLVVNKDAVYEELIFTISCQLAILLYAGFILQSLGENRFVDFVFNELVSYLILPSLAALMASYINGPPWQLRFFSQLEPQREVMPKLLLFYQPVLEKILESEYFKKITGSDLSLRYRESVDYFERWKRGELR